MPKKGRTSPELTIEERLLLDWLTKADNVTLACWDEGHWWWTPELEELGFSTKDGMLGVKEPCQREVDGLGCGVRRTRYINPRSGLLDGPSAVYDYSRAPKHKLPRHPDSGYSILSKETRAAIRLERKRRGHLGEEIR
jgi:hypothetical protein